MAEPRKRIARPMRLQTKAELRAKALERMRELQESGELVIRQASEAELEAVFGKRKTNGDGDNRRRRA